MKSQYTLSGVASNYNLELKALPKFKVVIAAYRLHGTEQYSKPYIIVEDTLMKRYAVNFKKFIDCRIRS